MTNLTDLINQREILWNEELNINCITEVETIKMIDPFYFPTFYSFPSVCVRVSLTTYQLH